MAERIDAGLPQEDGEPWSKRASMTPRKTYSAESKIVYKRRRHYWTDADLERVSAAVLARHREQQDGDAFTRIIQWLKGVTIEMLEAILSLVGLQQFASVAYDLLYTIVSRMVQILPGTEELSALVDALIKAEESSGQQGK